MPDDQPPIEPSEDRAPIEPPAEEDAAGGATDGRADGLSPTGDPAAEPPAPGAGRKAGSDSYLYVEEPDGSPEDAASAAAEPEDEGFEKESAESESDPATPAHEVEDSSFDDTDPDVPEAEPGFQPEDEPAEEDEPDAGNALLADAAEALAGEAAEAPGEPREGAEPNEPGELDGPEAAGAPEPAAPDAEPAASPAAPPTADQREQAVVAASLHRRQQLLTAGWLHRAGIACTLVLLVLAAVIYVARRTTADAEWTDHLAWLAFVLPALAWALYISTARNTPPAERLRSQVERDLRRRDDEVSATPPRSVGRTPVAGTLTAGAAALLVVFAGTVPVARPRLEQAANTVTRQALGVEAKAETLRNAGAAGAGADGVRAEIRGLATPPRGFEEADLQRAGLAEIESDLDAIATRVAEEARVKLVHTDAAAALAAAFDLSPPPPEVAPDPPASNADGSPTPDADSETPVAPPAPARPGGLPPGAATALVTLVERSLGGETVALGEERMTLPEPLAASLRQSEAAGEPPSADALEEATRLVLARRAQLGRLLQRLAEGGFATNRAVAVSRADLERIDPLNLAARLRDRGSVDADAVLAACEALR